MLAPSPDTQRTSPAVFARGGQDFTMPGPRASNEQQNQRYGLSGYSKVLQRAAKTARRPAAARVPLRGFPGSAPAVCFPLSQPWKNSASSRSAPGPPPPQGRSEGLSCTVRFSKLRWGSRRSWKGSWVRQKLRFHGRPRSGINMRLTRLAAAKKSLQQQSQ